VGLFSFFQGSDMHGLKEGEWISDAVVHYYYNLLDVRNSEQKDGIKRKSA
jgi:Ulp1 family protease